MLPVAMALGPLAYRIHFTLLITQIYSEYITVLFSTVCQSEGWGVWSGASSFTPLQLFLTTQQI